MEISLFNYKTYRLNEWKGYLLWNPKRENYFWKSWFLQKIKKTEKMADVQTRITFFVSVWREKRKYESDAEFHGDFKNDNHLSNLLN